MKVKKNKSSLFINTILQCNNVLIIHFIYQKNATITSCINKVIQSIYSIYTFGFLEGRNANTIPPFSVNSTGGYCSPIYRQGTQPKQKYIYDPDNYTLL
jgi:hypothetical protein